MCTLEPSFRHISSDANLLRRGLVYCWKSSRWHVSSVLCLLMLDRHFHHHLIVLYIYVTVNIVQLTYSFYKYHNLSLNYFFPFDLPIVDWIVISYYELLKWHLTFDCCFIFVPFVPFIHLFESFDVPLFELSLREFRLSRKSSETLGGRQLSKNIMKFKRTPWWVIVNPLAFYKSIVTFNKYI